MRNLDRRRLCVRTHCRAYRTRMEQVGNRLPRARSVMSAPALRGVTIFLQWQERRHQSSSVGRGFSPAARRATTHGAGTTPQPYMVTVLDTPDSQSAQVKALV